MLTCDEIAPTSDWRKSKGITFFVWVVAMPQNFPFYRFQEEKNDYCFHL